MKWYMVKVLINNCTIGLESSYRACQEMKRHINYKRKRSSVGRLRGGVHETQGGELSPYP